MPGEQREVVAFLEKGHAEGAVERIDTHAAHVFLRGAEAIKIKRAVRYDYLDFSTLEQRRVALERELAINRPGAPGLYLRVVPITRDASGELTIGGAGEIVEWALVMRRFDQATLLSRICERQGISRELARGLAEAVARSHRDARPAEPADQRQRLRRIIEELHAGLSKAPLDAAAIARFSILASARLNAVAGLLDERAARGKVRRCHGDLHLGNIMLWEGRPTLFDAIEFDEDLATTDTLYDLAFLLMDLDVRGARAAANIVLNRYLQLSVGAPEEPASDLRGLAALPLLLALRSAIRAMVAAQRDALTEGASQASERDAARYLAAALARLEPPPAALVAIGGFSGTGKSTLAAALAPLIGPVPGAVHLRSDVERKLMHGVSETAPLPESAYRPGTSASVYASLGSKARVVLGAGHAVVLDAVFATSDERAAVEAIAQAAGVAFHGLWLEADAATMMARVSARTGDASDASPEVVRAQLARGAGAVGWRRIDAGAAAADTLTEAQRALSR